MSRRPSSRLLLVALAVAMVGAACSVEGHTANGSQTGDVAVAPPPQVYVAVGGADALGAGSDRPLTDAWPRQLYRRLGRGAVFVNAGATNSTVDEALQEQLPIALDMDATLVTVWLAIEDLGWETPAATYERELTRLVRALRQGGRARVLVANVPPAEALPAFEDRLARLPVDASGREQLAEDVSAYNDAIARVVAAEGAELIDLHAALDEAMADGSFRSLVTADGLPSPAGHDRIAELFAAAL